MKGLFTVDHALSTEETDEYLRKANAQTWWNCPVGQLSSQSNVYNSDVRNNAYFAFKDEKLAQAMFKIGESVMNDMLDGAGTFAKFIPVAIDPTWKCYRYEEGEFFGKHKDSGRRVKDLQSFVTVLIYLNGNEDEDEELKGGETIFYGPGCEEGFRVVPTRGKAVFFVHQLDHESVEVTEGTKYVLKSVVLFKKNENYGTNHSLSSSMETLPQEDVLIRVGDEAFRLTRDMLSDHPNCILNTMLTSLMNYGIKTDSVSGLKLFEFPERNPQIFKTYILPVLNNEKLPDTLTNHTLKDKVDSEFKFWGLLSPYDPILAISNEHDLDSKELSSISQLLKTELEETLYMMEWRLQFLKILEKVKRKKEQFFSLPLLFQIDSILEIMNTFDDLKKEGYKSFSNKWEFNNWVAQQIEQHFSSKFEVVPLKYHYDSNAFLFGQDRHLYELCEKIFGEAVSIRNIPFIYESNSMGSKCDIGSYPMKSVCYEMVERCQNRENTFRFKSFLRRQLNDGKITTISEILNRFEGVCIQMQYKDLLVHGRHEKSWKGEYNDEYHPNYSLFVLSAIVIDVSKIVISDH
ncbi:hypothetical protein C9374_013823 [Naegleria lovaniensis]|uniref:Prolyl 4-hydroxylase alpha subunit domain-containing protein n=1 Tax=Naegleria lovaniensis TaxID=51637 RepID=A0AA88GCT5_NAELO|nr:uncharacterized protein C9374_013823 [Naegleria lovaniensis]KAG2370819.1 hypothetical protein C9374_013823 [Naegleria lovaniensis]